MEGETKGQKTPQWVSVEPGVKMRMSLWMQKFLDLVISGLGARNTWAGIQALLDTA
jgi:hypothetical protein